MMKRLSMFVALACLGLALPMYADDAAIADGDYVLQNVTSGLYLAGGNAYGAEATLLSSPFVFTLTAVDSEDDAYTLTCSVYTSNGGLFYDGSNFYLDHNDYPYHLTIKEGEGDNAGTYTILCSQYTDNDPKTNTEPTASYYIGGDVSNGAVASVVAQAELGEGCYWKLISVSDIAATQAAALVGDKVDVTSLLKNPTFAKGLDPGTDASDTNWAYSYHVNTDVVDDYTGNYTYGIYTSNVWYGMLERWHAEDGYDLYQTLTDLPAGHYTLTAQAFQGDADDYPQRFYLYAGDEKAELPDVANSDGFSATTYANFLAGNYPVSVEFDVEDGSDDVKIGISDFYTGDENVTSMSWCVVAGLFNLYYEVPEYDDDEYAEGDTITIGKAQYKVTGENLFVNGSFNEGMTGWTAGGYTTAADASKFTLKGTGGFNGGQYLESHSGGTSDSTTPSQAIGVTSGSTYVFLCHTSGTTPTTTNKAYNALFNLTYENETYTEGSIVTEFNWGAEAEQTATDWTLTAGAFQAKGDYVGVRLGWDPGTNYDGFQLYKVEPIETVGDSEYSEGEVVVIGETAYTILSDNLVKNGGYEDGVSDWTAGGYSTAALADNFTITSTSGFNGKQFLTENTGGVASATTITQAVEVESGNTYLFVGYTSGTTPSTETNEGYSGLAKLNYEEGTGVSEDATTVYYTNLDWGTDLGHTVCWWTETDKVFEATTDYVGIRLAWTTGSFDGFQIYEVEETTLDVTTVQGAAEEATVPEVNIGTEAFQYNEEAVTALTSVVAAAGELVDGTSTLAEIVAVYNALNAATKAASTLNEPAEGDLFHVIMESDGHTYNGKALYFHRNDESHAQQGHYDMAFESEPNANLANQVFIFTPVDDVLNGYTISFNANPDEIDVEDDTDNTTLRYFCFAQDNGGGTGTQGFRTTIDPTKACTFVVEPDAETEGIVRLMNTASDSNGGHYVGTNGTTESGFYTDVSADNVACDLTITTAPDVIEGTLQAEYGTLVLPFAPTADEIEASGLTFYSTEAYESEPTLALVEAETVEAGVPYIVGGEEGTEYSFAVTARTFDTSATEGWLTGVYDNTDVPTSSYVLQDGEDDLAFYTVTTDDPITLEPNRCYLTVSETSESGAPAVVYFPGSNVETAISGVEANVADAEAIYDLSGRKVSNATKGIYIKGGKKVVIK